MNDSIEVDVKVVCWPCRVNVVGIWTLDTQTELRNLVLFD
jgi:hypothetical protein